MSDLWPFGELKRHHYRTLAIDPPYHFAAGTKSRPQHYARMRDAEIAALPIRELAHPDGCHVFLWVTSPKFFLIPTITKVWGARYSGRAFVWEKRNKDGSLWMSTGYTTRKNCEDCWLFKFGRPPRLSANVHEVIIAPRREHSRKPDEAYARIEQYSAGPRADLFARERRAGWDAFGDQLDMANGSRMKQQRMKGG